MAKRGRPSKYNTNIAALICERIAMGEPLGRIVAEPNMPGYRTVSDWLNRHPEFSAEYTRAREAQADEMDARILSAAEAVTAETAHADRVRIDAYKWRAARLNPQRYGDRQHVEHSGSVSIATALEEARQRRQEGRNAA